MKNDFKKIKAIAFDFWGVFAKMNSPMYEYMEKHHISPEKYKEKIHNLIISHDLDKLTEEQFLKECSKVVGLEIPYPQCSYKYRKGSLNSELIDIVQTLKSKYKIVLFSNNNKTYCQEYLFGTGLDKLFDVMIISYQVGYRKPAPEIYQILISRLSVKPEEILFLDDDLSKLPVASAHGIKTLLYDGKKTNKILASL